MRLIASLARPSPKTSLVASGRFRPSPRCIKLVSCPDSDASRYADALWARTDKFGLPRDTGFDSRAVYLSLPVPTDRTVSDAFRAYVEGSPFPIQGDKGPVAMTGDVPICFDIIDASRHLEWSNDDVCMLIDRAAVWWDSDKAWLTGRSEPHPFVSVRAILTERLQHLVDALAVVLSPEVMLNGEDARRGTLRRLAAEFRDYGLQVVRTRGMLSSYLSPSGERWSLTTSVGVSGLRKRSVSLTALMRYWWSLSGKEGRLNLTRC